jgi:hypothetical protein
MTTIHSKAIVMTHMHGLGIATEMELLPKKAAYIREHRAYHMAMEHRAYSMEHN